MIPFNPRGKENMIAWLAARSDSPNYGDMVVYQFSKQELIFGPMQIEARIDQDTDIFLNGFIDLVFREKDKYYILDWKSNYLKNGYQGKIFREEVIKNYELQYQIYLTASIEWLKNHFNNFNYKNNFGGIYYIYLRGIGINKENFNNGIFYYRPEEQDYKLIKSNLYKKIIERILQ